MEINAGTEQRSGAEGRFGEVGRYQLHERLSLGPFTELFRAASRGEEGFEKVLVIRRLRRAAMQNLPFLAEFVRLAHRSIQLSHANVVQWFDLGVAPFASASDTEGRYFIAQEYVDGMSLGALLERSRADGRALPVELVVFIAAEIAKGVDYAHRRRDDANLPMLIAHGDLGLRSVLISFDGTVKVHFEMASAMRMLASDSDFEGDRHAAFQSPEVRRGEPATWQSDIFALGALIVACLDTVPNELADLVSVACADDEASRFSSMAGFHEALLDVSKAHNWHASGHEMAEFIGRLRPSAVARAEDRFVGRRDELRQFGDTLIAAAKRTARVVTLTGPAGIGKSRFLHEVDRRLTKRGYDIGFYKAVCAPSDARYSSLVAMLNSIAERHDEMTSMRDVDPSVVPELLPSVVRVLSEKRLSVFVWEEAHLIDEDSASLLVALFPAIANTRAVFVLSGLEEMKHQEQLRAHVAIRLDPLMEQTI